MSDFYCINVRNVALDVSIGIHQPERVAAQPMTFSVVLMLAMPKPDHDDISAVVDYEIVRDEIASLAAERHWELQESLCSAITERLFEHRGVLGVIVRCAKTSVQPHAESIGCHMAKLSDELPAEFPWWSIYV